MFVHKIVSKLCPCVQLVCMVPCVVVGLVARCAMLQCAVCHLAVLQSFEGAPACMVLATDACPTLSDCLRYCWCLGTSHHIHHTVSLGFKVLGCCHAVPQGPL